MWVLEGHDRTLRNTLKMHGNYRLYIINAQHRVYTYTGGTGISINGSGKPTSSMCTLGYKGWETEWTAEQQGTYAAMCNFPAEVLK